MSVGHTARALEEGGIPTVIIAVAAFTQRLTEMRVPRALLTPFLMGRPLGYPGQIETQRAVLTAALALLETAQEGGTIIPFRT